MTTEESRPGPGSARPRGYSKSAALPAGPQALALITCWTGQHRGAPATVAPEYR